MRSGSLLWPKLRTPKAMGGGPYSTAVVAVRYRRLRLCGDEQSLSPGAESLPWAVG